jgi:hypothetical protein
MYHKQSKSTDFAPGRCMCSYPCRVADGESCLLALEMFLIAKRFTLDGILANDNSL